MSCLLLGVEAGKGEDILRYALWKDHPTCIVENGFYRDCGAFVVVLVEDDGVSFFLQIVVNFLWAKAPFIISYIL